MTQNYSVSISIRNVSDELMVTRRDRFGDGAWHIHAAAAAAAKSLQSCPTLCDPMDSSLPGSPIPGILKAKTLEWVAISFSKIHTSDMHLSWLSLTSAWGSLESVQAGVECPSSEMLPGASCPGWMLDEMASRSPSISKLLINLSSCITGLSVLRHISSRCWERRLE